MVLRYIRGVRIRNCQFDYASLQLSGTKTVARNDGSRNDAKVSAKKAPKKRELSRLIPVCNMKTQWVSHEWQVRCSTFK